MWLLMTETITALPGAQTRKVGADQAAVPARNAGPGKGPCFDRRRRNDTAPRSHHRGDSQTDRPRVDYQVLSVTTMKMKGEGRGGLRGCS